MRRRGRYRGDTSVPAGWTAHDGSGMPVAADARPALLFRYGGRGSAGTLTAGSYDDWAEGSCWRWSGRPARMFDIIAWRDIE